MLTPEQVIPFLTHADPLVRGQAVTYFRGCADAAPLTADDFWAAIDRFADVGDLGPFGLRATRTYYSHMRGVPQTAASLHRLTEALSSDMADDDAESLAETAAAVAFPLLLAHRDLLLNCPDLPPDVRDRLERRLAVADYSADAVWDRLMVLGLRGAASAEEDDDEEAADEEAAVLIEAAARHIDALADRAMSTLVDPRAEEDWRETFAVRVLGAARHGPAVAGLVDKLRVDDDVLVDEAVDALVRIGSAEVVAALVAFAPGQPWDVRLYADDPLGRIKRPESEAGLLHLLSTEADDQIRGNLLFALCDLGSLAGLDARPPARRRRPHAPRVAGPVRGPDRHGRHDRRVAARGAAVAAAAGRPGGGRGRPDGRRRAGRPPGVRRPHARPVARLRRRRFVLRGPDLRGAPAPAADAGRV